MQTLNNAVAAFMGSDGTFDVSPTPFAQLYTLCVDVNDVIVPVVAILMSNKSEALYSAVLEKLKLRCPFWGVGQFMADNEQAIHNAVRNAFPMADRRRCLFHYTQAVYRKAAMLGLAPLQRRDKLFQAWFARLQSIPTLPPDQLRAGFEMVQDQLARDVSFDYAYAL